MNGDRENLLSAVQTGKIITRKRPRMLFQFSLPAALQNVDCNANWRKGDPNTETTPDYDFVWIIWILRNIFPKDVVTHFVQTVGGCSFSVHRSLPIPEDHYPIPHMSLQFWKQRDLYSSVHREIYFNIPVHKIQRKKERVYLHHHNKKIAFLDPTS